MIPSIDEIDIQEKRVLIRVDLDLPLTGSGEIEDDSKIIRALPTIRYAIEQKAKIILASHLGKPGGRLNMRYTLEPVGRRISELLDSRIYFPENSVGDAVKKAVSDMLPGDVMLLENLDFHKWESTDGQEYAKRLSQTADVYVNEAFSISNQKRASLVAATKFFDTVSVGLAFKRELLNLERLREPERPFVVVVGGSEVARKVGFMEAMIKKTDTFLIGGAVGSTFLKALGKETGVSGIDDSCLYRVKKLISRAAMRDIRLIVPVDVVAVTENLRNDSTSYIILGDRIPGDSKVLDIGPKTRKEFAGKIKGAQTVLWNGPLGVCENPEFSKGTVAVANALIESSAFTAALGGHTVSVISSMGIKDREAGDSEGMDYISHSGDAALDYVENGTLPAIDALNERMR